MNINDHVHLASQYSIAISTQYACSQYTNHTIDHSSFYLVALQRERSRTPGRRGSRPRPASRLAFGSSAGGLITVLGLYSNVLYELRRVVHVMYSVSRTLVPRESTGAYDIYIYIHVWVLKHLKIRVECYSGISMIHSDSVSEYGLCRVYCKLFSLCTAVFPTLAGPRRTPIGRCPRIRHKAK